MNVLFYGNCQLYGIMKTLNLPDKIINCKYLDCYMSDFSNDYFKKVVSNSSIIITQPINDNYRNKDYLSTTFILENASSLCKIIIVDSLYFNFYYFDLTYTFFNDKLLQSPIDYHYNKMMECYKNGYDIKYYQDNYLNNKDLISEEKLISLAEDSINELNKRYEANKVKYKKENVSFVYTGDFIRSNYKDKLLFYSMNHPTKYLTQFVCLKLTKLLNISNTINYNLDQIDNPKCLLYKSLENVVNFNVNENKVLTLEKDNSFDIIKLYYDSYKSIKFK